MKIVKIDKKSYKINRKLVSKFGEMIYHCPDVKSVLIKINFKDGGTIGFKRDEEEDFYDQWEDCDD